MNTDKFEYCAMRYGLFVHFVPFITAYKNGEFCKDIDKLADSFNAERFADDVKAMGVEYVLFTAWHSQTNLLYPSEVMERWRPGHCSRRDLIGEMIKAVKNRGIAVLLYTHPRDGMEFSEEDKISTGWGAGRHENGWDPNPETFDFVKWNDFINEVYDEMMERYGNDIIGIFVDEGSPDGDSYRIVDYPRLRKTVKGRNEKVIILQNFYGDNYGFDLGMKEYGAGWNEFRNADGKYWPPYTMPVGTVIAESWMAAKKSDEDTLRYTPEDLFRYTALQAAVNSQGGGVAWAAGPYVDGGWEKGVLEALIKVGNYIDKVAESIKGTFPSKAYPAISGKAIKDLEWGAATASQDGKYEFLHVLKNPEGKTLILPVPENGAQYSSACMLHSKANVHLVQDNTGVKLTIEEEWDQVDTVIRLTVANPGNMEQNYFIINDTDYGITYVGDWEYSRWERNCGDYEGDIHITKQDGSYLEYSFTGSGIELIANRCPEHGISDVYVDNVHYGTINGFADEYIPQQILFCIRGLYGGEHRLRIIKNSGATLQVDAIKVYAD